MTVAQDGFGGGGDAQSEAGEFDGLGWVQAGSSMPGRAGGVTDNCSERQGLEPNPNPEIRNKF